MRHQQTFANPCRVMLDQMQALPADAG